MRYSRVHIPRRLHLCGQQQLAHLRVTVIKQAEPTTNNQCLRSGCKLVEAPDLLLIHEHWARSPRRQ